jgi:hypothetical protein
MIGRIGLATAVAAVVGSTELSYVLARAAAPVSPTAAATTVEFTSDGNLKQPVGYRKWVYVGTPLTPNALNGGKAEFPEFHSVYIDPRKLR